MTDFLYPTGEKYSEDRYLGVVVDDEDPDRADVRTYDVTGLDSEAADAHEQADGTVLLQADTREVLKLGNPGISDVEQRTVIDNCPVAEPLDN